MGASSVVPNKPFKPIARKTRSGLTAALYIQKKRIVTDEPDPCWQEALLSEDDIGKVVRTHLYVESLVNEFLSEFVPHPKHVKPMRLDYCGKVHLALAIGLPEKLKGMLLRIGGLRNDFAHESRQQLDKNNMKNLFDSFTFEQKTELLERTKNLSWVAAGKKWRDISPPEQFTVMAISLYYMVKVEMMLMKQAREHEREVRHLQAKAAELAAIRNV